MRERYLYSVMWLREIKGFSLTYYHRYTEFNCWPIRRNSWSWGRFVTSREGPIEDVKYDPRFWLSDIEKDGDGDGDGDHLLWIYEEVPWQHPIHDCWLYSKGVDWSDG